MREWLTSQNPAWVLLIFPLIFGLPIIGFLLDERKKAKRRRNPHVMSEDEYVKFNLTRFRR